MKNDEAKQPNHQVGNGYTISSSFIIYGRYDWIFLFHCLGARRRYIKPMRLH